VTEASLNASAAMPDRGWCGGDAEVERYRNRSEAAWQRLNGSTIFKRRSRLQE
jgi:hypothetical protein